MAASAWVCALLGRMDHLLPDNGSMHARYSPPPERLVIPQFLSVGDSNRAFHTLRKLGLHDISRWVLVGGIAVEFYCVRGGRTPSIRHLNDIDFGRHAARLLLDLDASVLVPGKHAGDYLRLPELAKSSEVEAAWQDHRKPNHPMTFWETNTLVKRVIVTCSGLLIRPEYSKNIVEICPVVCQLLHSSWLTRTSYSGIASCPGRQPP